MTAVQLPFRTGPATKVGRHMFRKQVLPVGSINYKGADGVTTRIDFTPEYLADLANNFNAGAYDQVPFLLAAPDNSHHMDPERYRGEVKALELSEDGLYGVIELSKQGAALVKDNPRLGVSARIVPDPPRTDGKRFTKAIQHVLGTMDPRVTGMKPWQEVQGVDLSNDPTFVDLTMATYQGEGTMPELTEEELTAFRTFLTNQAAATEAATKEPTAEEKAAADAALEARVQAAIDAAAATEEVDETDLVGASLSTEERAAIDLANAQASEARDGLAVLRRELDDARFTADRDAYVAAGVSPAVMDLAQPLMTGSHVIDLSNSETLNVAEQVRKILDECKGMIDLSSETPAAQKMTDEETEILARFDEQFPVTVK